MEEVYKKSYSFDKTKGDEVIWFFDNGEEIAMISCEEDYDYDFDDYCEAYHDACLIYPWKSIIEFIEDKNLTREERNEKISIELERWVNDERSI